MPLVGQISLDKQDKLIYILRSDLDDPVVLPPFHKPGFFSACRSFPMMLLF